jgi:hypothetical protein
VLGSKQVTRMTRLMLTEDEVNRAVAAYLKTLGWVRVIALDGRQHGVDVEGEHPTTSRKVPVESKLGMSGDPGTKKFGQPCSPTQVRSDVAKAVFTALCSRERSRTNTVLIALPDDEVHLTLIGRLTVILKGLSIGLFAVSPSGVRPLFGAVDPDPASATLEPLEA